MDTAKTDRSNQASPCLPNNLRHWLDKSTLLRLCLDAVQTVDWNQAGASPTASGAQRPQMLATLLTYCYATGLYGSEDIELATRDDRTARYICAHNFPSSRQIQMFRRRHRPVLRHCLARVYQQAWTLRLDQGEVTFDGFGWSEEALRREIDRLVDEKIQLAILLDRSLCDD